MVIRERHCIGLQYSEWRDQRPRRTQEVWSCATALIMVYWSRYWVVGAASAFLLGHNTVAQLKASQASGDADKLKLVQIIVRCASTYHLES